MQRMCTFMACAHVSNDLPLADEAPGPAPEDDIQTAICSATSWGYAEATNKDQSAVAGTYPVRDLHLSEYCAHACSFAMTFSTHHTKATCLATVPPSLR